MLPRSFDISYNSMEHIRRVIKKSEEKELRFESTASYGELHIDSFHRMFMMGDGKNRNFGDCFYISELLDLSIYCENIRNAGTSTNKVLCDVKIKFKTKDAEYEYDVKRNDLCRYKKSGDGLLVSENEKLTMFRSMFYQMIDDEALELNRILTEINEVNKKVLRMRLKTAWAKGVLLMDMDGCTVTAEDVKKKRRDMMKLVHPDGNTDADVLTAQMVNDAADILIESL